MRFFGLTDKGSVRKENQDTFYTSCDDAGELAILLVCDGMGGARAGNVASELACRVFAEELQRTVSPGVTVPEAEKAMEKALDTANSAVYQLGNAVKECSGMGTTLVAAVVTGGGKTAVVNVGDSRAYHLGRSGIRQITRDHSVVADMVARGDLTPEQSINHPNRNLITRALGTSPEVKCDCFEVELGENESILLCTDGLTNMVSEEEMAFRAEHSQSVEECCGDLMKLAIARGAPDNVTVVMLKL